MSGQRAANFRTARTAERDPVEPGEWVPTSSTWRREDAKRQTAEAVRRSKEARSTVNRPHDEETAP